jgi:23S rRNA (pseudouridine1915-N3)-methyltransferase
VIVLDEKGRDMTSVALANHLQEYYTSPSGQSLVFIIGGADGLDDSIIQSAQLHLSFGKQTWPHMMVRLMLVEQLYRIQTILTGHPYHRV